MGRFDAFTTVNSTVSSATESEGKGVNSLRKENSFLRKEASLSVPQVLPPPCLPLLLHYYQAKS